MSIEKMNGNNSAESDSEDIIGPFDMLRTLAINNGTPRKNNREFFSQLAGDEEVELEGGNLGKVSGLKLMLPSERWAKDLTEEEAKGCRVIEDLYRDRFERTEGTTPHAIELDDEGKVIVEPGTAIHSFIPRMNTLKGIAKCGVLASEWFGVIESESEALMCAFINKILSNDELSALGKEKKEDGEKRMGGHALFFDMENPLMREIVDTNYFQWRRDRASHPDSLEKYPEGLREAYEKTILPNSPGMLDKWLTNPAIDSAYWGAVPGGIPPQLINGILIQVPGPLADKMEEIAKLFPNATIFGPQHEVFYRPERSA